MNDFFQAFLQDLFQFGQTQTRIGITGDEYTATVMTPSQIFAFVCIAAILILVGRKR